MFCTRSFKRMVGCGWSRKRLFLLTVASLVVTSLFIMYSSSEIFDDARVARVMSLSAIQQSILLDPGGPCNFPDLPVNSSAIMRFMQHREPLKCTKGGVDWAKCERNICQVKPEIFKLLRSVQCKYSDIIWKSDFSSKFEDPIIVPADHQYRLTKSDFVSVECVGTDKNGVQKTWTGTLIGIREDEQLKARLTWEKLSGEAMRYNVLMFGFDSLSRNTFMRKLPKSYDYLTKELKAQILKGYNIVGDGTPQALIPILTGKTELELPDTRKRMGDKASFVDVYPFVWEQFKNNGYVTAFHEDTPGCSIFTYRLKGFKNQPTDHYMRQYYINTAKLEKKWSPYCNGDTPRHKIMLDYTRQFMDAYADYPRFAFAFHGELSHDDYNQVQAADGDLEDWLRGLKTSGILDNTLLIIMSDHGHRFAAIRDTLQGKQEERLPWFSLVAPAGEGPLAARLQQLAANTARLTTPFDVHASLLDVLGANPHRTYDIRSKFPPRSLSLFGPIPENRTCGQAGIEPHWCACLTWRPLSLLSNFPHTLATQLVMAINKLTSPFRSVSPVVL